MIPSHLGDDLALRHRRHVIVLHLAHANKIQKNTEAPPSAAGAKRGVAKGGAEAKKKKTTVRRLFSGLHC